jgi:putative protease
MSSFIGGYSGNRGLCAQACRRKWKYNNKEGFYLSPKDLDLSAFIKELSTTSVCSLKIEGRMKNPQYVYKTVKAYKMLVESKGLDENVIRDARRLLEADFARPKTTFNFINKSLDIFAPDIPKQIGLNLGKIISVSKQTIKIETSADINLNDEMKVVDGQKDQSFKFKILGIKKDGNVYEIETDLNHLKEGMFVFKVSDSKFARVIDEITASEKIEKESFVLKEAREIVFPKFKKSLKNQPELFIKIDDMQWAKFINNDCGNIIFSLNKKNLAYTQNFSFFELPPFIEEADLPLYKQKIQSLIKEGKNKFFLNNISHFEFFENTNAKLFGGSFLYSINSFAADFIFKKGIGAFVLSPEDDFKNISELAKSGLADKAIFYLSGFHLLAVSKMIMPKDFPADNKAHFIDSSKDSFQIISDGDKTFVLPKYPIMLFDKKSRLQKLQVNKFLIDLSFIKPNADYLNALIDAYNGKSPIKNENEFNFERGLR